MSEILLLKLFHVLLFVYWLGGDLGTYYSSRYVVNPNLSPAQRSTALNIMLGVDQGPRLAMALIFAPGIHLAAQYNLIAIADPWLALIWMICLLWFVMVLTLHFAKDKAYIPVLSKIDFYFRIILVGSLLGIGFYSLVTNALISASWVSWKIIIFALLVACGLAIRIHLKSFIPAFQALMTQGPSDKVNQELNSSIAKCRPFVYFIWLGLLLNAALGMHVIR